MAKGPAPLFCAAPWLEGVLYNDGAFRICSRNPRSFGDWRAEDLADLWKVDGLRAFRRDVAGGRYPDSDCAACHLAGTAQSLGRILTTPLENSLRYLVEGFFILHEEYLSLLGIRDLFSLDAPEADARLEEFEKQVKFLLFRFRLEGHGEHLAKLKKIQNILAIVRAFRAGSEAPPVVAPFRQAQLIAKCNARCVMCPGKFSGEIVNGGAISEENLERALAEPGHIVDFFCNGSEFLLFKGWREVAQRLRAGGVASLRLSTNGMLLTPATSEFLVDQDVIGHLNISLNAGTRETLERVQQNVRWDRLMANIEHLLDYAEKRGRFFPMSFSFIVLRSNFQELPEFVRRVGELRKRLKVLQPHAMIMGLENAPESGYREFLAEEHPSRAPAEDVRAAFAAALAEARAAGVEARLYNFGAFETLEGYGAAGFPEWEFVPGAGEMGQRALGLNAPGLRADL